MIMAREIAGLSTVCKTVREGFDSLLRLQIRAWLFRQGESFGYWVLDHQRSAFLAGTQYAAFKHEKKRNYPADKPAKAESYKLMVSKHQEMIKALTDFSNLQKKHIIMSKELSRLKRLRSVS